MKNLVKVLGIIAVIAVVGLAVSCEVDPEDQVKISISGIPNGADGLYAYFALAPGKDKTALAALSDSNNKIANGELSTYMVDKDGKPFDKEGNYFVLVFIHDALITGENIEDTKYTFYTTSPVKIVKGSNSYMANEFKDADANTIADTFPTIAPVTPNVDAEEEIVDYIYDGEFKANYNLNGTMTDEFVTFNKTSFKIYEKNAAGGKTDYLDFVINKDWAYDPVPSAVYEVGFKFTGYISAGKPVGANIYGGKTAPGFTQADITNQTEACMFIYFKKDGSFVRTVFSKTSATTPDKTLITGNEEPAKVRNYTKVPK